MARPRRRKKLPAPSTRLADRLEDAADYTARYDAPVDWADGRSTTTEKLIRSAGIVRYWRAGAPFQQRMVRSVLAGLAIIAAWIVIAIVF